MRCLVLLLLFCAAAFSWSSSYSEALAQAKEAKKPLLIAFVGAEWCPWSKKIASEVLEKESFLTKLQESAICVRVDLPYVGTPKESQQLKRQFHISELPMFVLVSSTEEEIAKIGYLPLNAEEFATHLTEIFVGYAALVQRMEAVDLHQETVSELHHLYSEASRYHLHRYKEQILQAGIDIDPSPFFLLEQYVAWLKNEPKKAKAVRKQIVARDPDNKQGALLKLAFLDFQELSEKRAPTFKVLKPLKKYLKKFGEKDRENQWRVHMTIAQFLFHRQEAREKMLKHVHIALKMAPESQKTELQTILQQMQGK